MRFSIQSLIWLLVLLAIILTGAFAVIPNPVNVEMAAVIEGPLRVSVQEDGKTRIREKYIVSAPVSGRLSRVELKPGDAIVAKSTLLAVILPSAPEMLDARSEAQANARVQAAEATVQRAQSSAEQARINYDLSKSKYDRARQLISERAISQDGFDIAKAEFMAKQQALHTSMFDSQIARFELEMARTAVKQFTDAADHPAVKPFEIFSPVSGKVLRVFQESSTAISMGTALMELGDPNNLEIEIDVLSTDAVRLKRGAELTVEHWGGESALKGKVRVIEPAAFTKVSSLGVEEQRVNVIADFDEPPDRIATLGDGYRVEAKITVDQLNNALIVPNSALFRHQRQWHVFVVDKKIASMIPVTIGLQNETYTQITEGLQQGQEVIVYPSDELSVGTRVQRANIK